ncbi:MAG: hypothetical protein HQK83_00690 [Fibrobacteria bacterium]|nr:hypothetical protein [Fibrobacteria bacterium]
MRFSSIHFLLIIISALIFYSCYYLDFQKKEQELVVPIPLEEEDTIVWNSIKALSEISPPSENNEASRKELFSFFKDMRTAFRPEYHPDKAYKQLTANLNKAQTLNMVEGLFILFLEAPAFLPHNRTGKKYYRFLQVWAEDAHKEKNDLVRFLYSKYLSHIKPNNTLWRTFTLQKSTIRPGENFHIASHTMRKSLYNKIHHTIDIDYYHNEKQQYQPILKDTVRYENRAFRYSERLTEPGFYRLSISSKIFFQQIYLIVSSLELITKTDNNLLLAWGVSLDTNIPPPYKLVMYSKDGMLIDTTTDSSGLCVLSHESISGKKSRPFSLVMQKGKHFVFARGAFSQGFVQEAPPKIFLHTSLNQYPEGGAAHFKGYLQLTDSTAPWDSITLRLANQFNNELYHQTLPIGEYGAFGDSIPVALNSGMYALIPAGISHQDSNVLRRKIMSNTILFNAQPTEKPLRPSLMQTGQMRITSRETPTFVLKGNSFSGLSSGTPVCIRFSESAMIPDVTQKKDSSYQLNFYPSPDTRLLKSDTLAFGPLLGLSVPFTTKLNYPFAYLFADASPLYSSSEEAYYPAYVQQIDANIYPYLQIKKQHFSASEEVDISLIPFSLIQGAEQADVLLEVIQDSTTIFKEKLTLPVSQKTEIAIKPRKAGNYLIRATVESYSDQPVSISLPFHVRYESVKMPDTLVISPVHYSEKSGDTAIITIHSKNPAFTKNLILATTESNTINAYTILSLDKGQATYKSPLLEGSPHSTRVTFSYAYGNGIKHSSIPIQSSKKPLIPKLRFTGNKILKPGETLTGQLVLQDQFSRPLQAALSVIITPLTSSLDDRVSPPTMTPINLHLLADSIDNENFNCRLPVNNYYPSFSGNLYPPYAKAYHDIWLAMYKTGTPFVSENITDISPGKSNIPHQLSPELLRAAKHYSRKRIPVDSYMLPKSLSLTNNDYVWIPHITTDDSGRADIHLTMPGTRDTWLFIVRGASQNNVFTYTDTLVTDQGLEGRLVAPGNVLQYNTTSAQAMVRNFSTEPISVFLALFTKPASDHFITSPDSLIEINLEPRELKRVTWPICFHIPGIYTLYLRTQSSTQIHTDSTTINVSALSQETHYQSGFIPEIKKGGKNFYQLRFNLPDTGKALLPKFDLYTWPTISHSLHDATLSLQKTNPTDIPELIASFLPRLSLFHALKGTALELLTTEGEEALYNAFNTFVDWQNTDGGWGWHETDSSDLLMSAFTLQALGKAYPYVSSKLTSDGQDMYRQGLNYAITKLRARDLNDTYKMYLASALCVNKRCTEVSKDITSLYERKKYLSSFALALLLETCNILHWPARSDTLLQLIESRALEIASEVSWSGDYRYPWFNQPLEATAQVVSTLAQYYPKHRLLPKTIPYLSRKKKGAKWATTKGTTLVICALSKWVTHNDNWSTDYTGKTFLNREKIHSYTINKNTIGTHNALFPLPLAKLKKDNQVILGFEGTGTMQYASVFTHTSSELAIPAENKELAISRFFKKLTYEKDKTNGWNLVRSVAGDSAQTGDEWEVTLAIKTYRDFQYVIIKSHVPAGFNCIDKNKKLPGLTEKKSTVTQRSLSCSSLKQGVGFQNLAAGEYHFSYYLEASTAGTYFTKPASISLAHTPGISGQTKSHQVHIFE